MFGNKVRKALDELPKLANYKTVWMRFRIDRMHNVFNEELVLGYIHAEISENSAMMRMMQWLGLSHQEPPPRA